MFSKNLSADSEVKSLIIQLTNYFIELDKYERERGQTRTLDDLVGTGQTREIQIHGKFAIYRDAILSLLRTKFKYSESRIEAISKALDVIKSKFLPNWYKWLPE